MHTGGGWERPYAHRWRLRKTVYTQVEANLKIYRFLRRMGYDFYNVELCGRANMGEVMTNAKTMAVSRDWIRPFVCEKTVFR